MKVYLAGSFQSQKRLRPLRDKLWEMGHEVIGTWLDECAKPEEMTPAIFDKQLAMKDLTEVRAADCLILDLIDPSTTGGRTVEWGYALGHAKLRYIVGEERECIFFRLADIAFADWEALFEHFEENHAITRYVATGMEGKKFINTPPVIVARDGNIGKCIVGGG